MNNENYTNFGFEEIQIKEKTLKVKDLFSQVASQYDLMNDLMSFGIHRYWKKQFIQYLPLKADQIILDVAGGTGDIALGIKKNFSYLNPKILVCDLTPAMIERGINKSINQGILHNLLWCAGNGEQLPLPNNSIDIYTIAFGLRNITNKDQALQEAFRVLKPGGHFFCLEFSHIATSFLSKLYDIYSFSILPFLGKIVADNKNAYQYLVESIRRFPNQEKLMTLIQDVGFNQVSYETWLKGIASLHIAKKII